ncbi:enoyl-CoA hydratase/isomerase [Paenibacillus sp. HN-1]|uniref:enoyl-CoA hydratase/isomerase n=1 Tax=Paenibacillus TaxID=44249 RepID=UPI001CA9F092|nr:MULTISPECIES: enoyl-CoA hydratase/isomerase [Paenibacillus]MBY9081320.1 enoyl-CoA hydratase/isomerase [Paenibacillus sp. CGMCC 1.18879]MBY9086495.1 enoyl-CoA hydratase/isomerase [Paenibacillus sinensis]
MSYQTIQVRFQEPVCFLQIHRPEANNTINDCLIEECRQVLELCDDSITVVVLEGLPEVFCFGADFQEFHGAMARGEHSVQNPEPLYDLWMKLATGPYISVAHVRGKVNAGGVGFAAACDIVLADETAQFSLSELLFGLLPSCVLPFLIRRVGLQKANYLTLTTQPISAQQACAWGLVDACDAQSDILLRKHLLRLKHLPKKGISRYKSYLNNLNGSLLQSKSAAIASNLEVFSDPQNINLIVRYVEKGLFPWEDSY